MVAKKRGKKRKKNTKEVRKVEHELPGGFWRQMFAVFLIAVAIFCVASWFGHGGTILNEVSRVCLEWVGVAVYVLPFLLVYLAVKIFRSETNQVAFPVWVASILMLVWAAGAGEIWGY